MHDICGNHGPDPAGGRLSQSSREESRREFPLLRRHKEDGRPVGCGMGSSSVLRSTLYHHSPGKESRAVLATNVRLKQPEYLGATV